MKLLGTPVDAIDLAEDRERFGGLLGELGIRAPPYGIARDGGEAIAVGEQGRVPAAGAARRTCSAAARWSSATRRPTSRRYVERLAASGDEVAQRMYPLLLDRFLENAIELDVDALADGEDVYVAGIMQHVEEAGVHSGDSACVLPPLSLGERDARGDPPPDDARWRCELGVVGLLNVQFAARRQRAAARDRGQPARLPHGAVRLEGDRRAAREGRLPPDPRRAPARPGAAGGAASPAT